MIAVAGQVQGASGGGSLLLQAMTPLNVDGDGLEPDSRVQKDGRRNVKAQPQPPSESFTAPLPVHSQLPDEPVATDHTGKTHCSFIRKEGIS